MKKILSNSNGVAQSSIVVAVSVITLVVLAVVISLFVRSQIAARAEDKRLTKEMAEFGLTLALNKISETPGWTEGFSNVKYRNGYYSVTIEKNGDNLYQAVSSGYLQTLKTVITYRYRIDSADGALKPVPLSPPEYN